MSSSSGSEGELRYEKRDKAAWITLNRPDQLNALSRSLIHSIIEASEDAASDPDVWAVIFRGAGGRAFCVGADLKERNAENDAAKRPVTPMTGVERNLFEVVLELPKPTLACVEGYALGGGFELALACDLRIASDDAMFGMPEAKIGMGANFGSVLLPRLLPRAIAMEMLYLADRYPASKMAELGLVNHVWPKADLETRCEELVAALLENAPVTLRRYKEMVSKGWELPVQVALRLNVGPNPYVSEDREEGIRAFNEKRKPNWSGR